MRSNGATKTGESMPAWLGRGGGDASQTRVPHGVQLRPATGECSGWRWSHSSISSISDTNYMPTVLHSLRLEI